MSLRLVRVSVVGLCAVSCQLATLPLLAAQSAAVAVGLAGALSTDDGIDGNNKLDAPAGRAEASSSGAADKTPPDPAASDLAPPGTAADDAESRHAVELVRAMSMALKTLNYEGTFVHLQGHHVTSMHILHSSDVDGEIERMVSLDGEAREVLRNHSLVTCIWPDTQAVVITKSKPRQLLPNVDERLAGNRRYHFRLRPDDRVAGLATHVVEVLPMDRYRYGYRFWIDKATSMLLRSMLLDGPDQAVEQMMFTAIAYPEHIESVRFKLSPAEERMSWLEPGVASARAGNLERVQNDVDRVVFAALPDGYAEVSETYRPMPLEERPVSHVMVSDGMASVSVYVEHQPPESQDRSSSGLSSMGAMNAFGLSLPKGFVTVVGEVPASTVEAIAAAVQIRE